jgi:hypothetical protein
MMEQESRLLLLTVLGQEQQFFFVAPAWNTVLRTQLFWGDTIGKCGQESPQNVVSKNVQVLGRG